MNSNDPFYTLYEFNNIPLTESEETSKLYVLAHSQKDAMELASKSGFFKKEQNDESNLEVKVVDGYYPNIKIIIPQHIISDTLTLE